MQFGNYTFIGFIIPTEVGEGYLGILKAETFSYVASMVIPKFSEDPVLREEMINIISSVRRIHKQ